MKRSKHNVPKENTIYVNPYSEDQVGGIQKHHSCQTCTAFIDTKQLNPGDYSCKPRIEMGEAKLSIPLTEFKFKVERNGSVAPDFYDLKVVDISFEFKNHDEAVSNEQAICKLRKNERDTHFTHFECKTDMNGRFKQVLPPGFVNINIPSFGIEVNSKIIEPAQVTTREDALKIIPLSRQPVRIQNLLDHLSLKRARLLFWVMLPDQ